MKYTDLQEILNTLVNVMAEAEAKPGQDITYTQEWAELRRVTELHRPDYVNVEANKRKLAVIERQ